MTFRDITYRWSSVAAIAADAGVTKHAIRQWRERNNIPADRWPLLIAGANARGIDLSYADFVLALQSTHGIQPDHHTHVSAPLHVQGTQAAER